MKKIYSLHLISALFAITPIFADTELINYEEELNPSVSLIDSTISLSQAYYNANSKHDVTEFQNLLDLKYKAYCENEQDTETIEQLAQEFDEAYNLAIAYLAYPFYDTVFSCYTKITLTQIALLEVIIETAEKAPAGSPFIRSDKELAHSKPLLGKAQELFNNQQLDPDFLSPECKTRIASHNEASNSFSQKAQATSTYKTALNVAKTLTCTALTYYIWTQYQARRGFFANIGR